MPQWKEGSAISQDTMSGQDFVKLPKEGEEPLQVMLNFNISKDAPLGQDHLLRYLRLGACSGPLSEGMVKKICNGDKLRTDEEHHMLVLLQQAIESMLAAYPRTLQDDEAALEQLPKGKERFGTRAAQALCVVESEKRLLQGSLAAVSKRRAAAEGLLRVLGAANSA